MVEMRFKPQGKVAEKEEFVNQEVTLNQKFLYACKPTDLMAIRSWAHTQEELFAMDSTKNKNMDALIKKIDHILHKTIFGGSDAG